MKEHNIHGMLGWSALDQFFRLGFQFLVVIILARILTPSDFGVYAMLAIFVGLANTLANAGLTDALIQRKVTTHQEESSLFIFSVCLALVISLIMCATAHWIAKFYQQPSLENITYAMAFCVFIGSFGSIQTALFSKVLDFKTTALIGAIAAAVSGIVAVLAALKGWGVWSLVVQSMAVTMISTLLLWAVHPWRPNFVFNLKSIQPYLKFGGYLLFSRLINVVSVNLYTLVIGRLYTAQDVGVFNRALNFQNLLVNSMSGVVAKVAFPLFSTAANDLARLERGLNKALLGTVFMSVPISIALVLLAEPLVLTLFGEQWTESVPVLQVLGLEALIWPLHLINVNLLMSMGRGDLMFKGVLVKFVVTSVLLLIAAPYGIEIMAITFVMSSYLNLLVNVYFTKQVFNYGLLKQIRAVVPCFIAGLSMILVILLAQYFLQLNFIVELLLFSLAGGSAYLMASALLGIYNPADIRKLLNLKR